MVQTPGEIPGVCRDPDDNQILACAVAADADYLVTGNEDLLFEPTPRIFAILPAFDIVKIYSF